MKSKKTTSKAAKTACAYPQAGCYSEKLAAEICRRISEGESLTAICKESKSPSKVTFFRWLADKPDLREKYARARQEQADHYVEEMLEICDSATNETAQSARLRVDTRKWIACKLHPRVYGEKLDVTTRDETPAITREWMVETMRKSPDFLAEVESMVAEAKSKP